MSKAKYHDKSIADFGCGEGRLELDLKKAGHKGKIHSFDVGKSADHVIQTDCANVPLNDRSVDIGVFSLSLMGTNFPDFLVEANRVLKKNGTLFVAEVLSRFTDLKAFLKHMQRETGFKAIKVQKLKEFFYILIFTKTGPAAKNTTKTFAE